MVLAIGNQPDRRKPFVQPEWRVFEDSSNLHAELTFRMASLALPDAARRDKTDLLRTTTRANDAPRPATRNQVIQAVIRIGEIDNRFSKGGGFLCHDRTLPKAV